MAEVRTVHFRITGEAVTEHFRNMLLEGDSRQTLADLQDSLIGMTVEQARAILRGEKKLVGTDVLFVDDEGYSQEQMEELGVAYYRQKEVPGIFSEEEMGEYVNTFYLKEERAADRAKEFDEYWATQLDMEEKLYGTRNGIDVTSYLDKMEQQRKDWNKLELQRKPEPITNLEEHTDHLSWFIDPEGNYFKIPFQGHDDWTDKFKECLPFDDFCDSLEHGWVRITTTIKGNDIVVIEVDFKSNLNYNALLKFIKTFSGYQFELGCSVIAEVNGEYFSGRVDYKTLTRIVNTYKRKANDHKT